jgi:hypothetical protein
MRCGASCAALCALCIRLDHKFVVRATSSSPFRSKNNYFAGGLEKLVHGKVKEKIKKFIQNKIKIHIKEDKKAAGVQKSMKWSRMPVAQFYSQKGRLPCDHQLNGPRNCKPLASPGGCKSIQA